MLWRWRLLVASYLASAKRWFEIRASISLSNAGDGSSLGGLDLWWWLGDLFYGLEVGLWGVEWLCCMLFLLLSGDYLMSINFNYWNSMNIIFLADILIYVGISIDQIT